MSGNAEYAVDRSSNERSEYCNESDRSHIERSAGRMHTSLRTRADASGTCHSSSLSLESEAAELADAKPVAASKDLPSDSSRTQKAIVVPALSSSRHETLSSGLVAERVQAAMRRVLDSRL